MTLCWLVSEQRSEQDGQGGQGGMWDVRSHHKLGVSQWKLSGWLGSSSSAGQCQWQRGGVSVISCIAVLRGQTCGQPVLCWSQPVCWPVRSSHKVSHRHHHHDILEIPHNQPTQNTMIIQLNLDLIYLILTLQSIFGNYRDLDRDFKGLKPDFFIFRSVYMSGTKRILRRSRAMW